MMAMWILLFIKTIDIPYYFGRNYTFAGWDKIITIPNIMASFSVIMLMISICSVRQLKHRLKGTPGSLPVKIISSVSVNVDYVNTLASLITLFSVLLLDYKTVRDVFLFAAMIFFIFVCYNMTNLYYCNPVFAALKFKISKVNTNNPKLPDDSILLHRNKIGEYIQPYHWADNVYIETICQEKNS